MTPTPIEYLRANREHILAELVEFASIPSVSTDPQHLGAVEQAARWVAGQIAAAGPFEVQLVSTAHHPAVYGEWLAADGAPTILVYGHYDVQPPDPLEKWASDPFRPELRQGRLYGRGVSDDKGPMLIPIKVAQAFFATVGALPVNVKFLFEGEEEIGSPSLEGFIRDNAASLAADFVISADGGMWRSDEPSITLSSRGVIGLELTVTGPGKDLHSGRHGGSVANPLHAIAELIASLHTVDGRVAVAGFYDQVEELPAAERDQLTALPFDERRYLEEVGAVASIGEVGYTTLERQWVRPTLEVNGLWGGYQGPGSKTVIPAEAHAKITCRLVPNQTSQDVIQKVVKHLEGHVPPGVRLAVRSDNSGAEPYQIAPDHAGLKIAEAVLREVYGKQPLIVRIGGTVPVCGIFKELLGLDTVFFSFATADEDTHAPNEFFRIHRLYEGLEAWALYWERLGAGDGVPTIP